MVAAHSLRPATVDDIPAVVAIELQSHALPWNAEGFAAELTKPYARFWLITDDETDSVIMGYIVFWIIDKECRILNVVVEPSHRGQGLGSDLMRQAIREALRENCVKAVLEVRKSNLPAVQLYQNIGFTISQISKAFYSDGEDAYLMALDLTGAEVIQF